MARTVIMIPNNTRKDLLVLILTKSVLTRYVLFAGKPLTPCVSS